MIEDCCSVSGCSSVKVQLAYQLLSVWQLVLAVITFLELLAPVLRRGLVGWYLSDHLRCLLFMRFNFDLRCSLQHRSGGARRNTLDDLSVFSCLNVLEYLSSTGILVDGFLTLHGALQDLLTGLAEA